MNKKFKKAVVGLCVGIMSLGAALGLSACGKDEVPAGESAYEIAVRHGFTGTEAEWLTSLKGVQGETGGPGDPLGALPEIGANGNWWIDGVDTNISALGTPGENAQQGPAGLSAYEIWRKYNKGSTLTEKEWLEKYVYGKQGWSDYDLELLMLNINMQFHMPADDPDKAGVVELSRDITIPADNGGILVVPDGKKLVVPNGVELTVAGTLVNYNDGRIEVAEGGKITVVDGGLFTNKNGLFGAGDVEFMSGSYFYNNGGMIKDGAGITYTFNNGATYIDNSTSIEGGMGNIDLPTSVENLSAPPAAAAITYFLNGAAAVPGNGANEFQPFAVLSPNAQLAVTKNSSNVLVLDFKTAAGETSSFGTQINTKRRVVSGEGTLRITGTYTMQSGAMLEVRPSATVAVAGGGALTAEAGTTLSNNGRVLVEDSGRLAVAGGLTVTPSVPPAGGQPLQPATISGVVPGNISGLFEVVGNYVVEEGETLTVSAWARLTITGRLTAPANSNDPDAAPVGGTISVAAGSTFNEGTLTVTRGTNISYIYGTVPMGLTLELNGNYAIEAGRTLTVLENAALEIVGGTLTVREGATLATDGGTINGNIDGDITVIE